MQIFNGFYNKYTGSSIKPLDIRKNNQQVNVDTKSLQDVFHKQLPLKNGIGFCGDVKKFPINTYQTSKEPINEEYLNTIDGQIEWTDWASLQLNCKDKKMKEKYADEILNRLNQLFDMEDIEDENEDDTDNKVSIDYIIIDAYQNGEKDKINLYFDKTLKLINQLAYNNMNKEVCQFFTYEINKMQDTITKADDEPLNVDDFDKRALTMTYTDILDDSNPDNKDKVNIYIELPLKNFDKTKALDKFQALLNRIEQDYKSN